jgi:hypothetical protein
MSALTVDEQPVGGPQLADRSVAALTVDEQRADLTDVAPGAASAIELNINGIPGPRGPAGAPGADAPGIYRHTQNIAADTWLIVHLLGYRPNVAVTDTAGSLVYADEVIYIDGNTVQLTFSEPLAGAAFLS